MPRLSRCELLLFACPLLIGGIYMLSRTPLAFVLRLDYPRENARRSSCSVNLREISLALSQYVQDCNGRYPFASRPGVARTFAYTRLPAGSPFGWSEAIYPYLKSNAIFFCAADRFCERNGIDPTKPGYTSFWYNANLSGVPLAAVKTPERTFEMGDGDDGTDRSDATYNITNLPPHWQTDYDMPAYRHLGKANYAYLDGHVSQLSPRVAGGGCGDRPNCFALG